MNTKERKFFHFRPLFYGFLAFLLAISSTRYVFAGNVRYIVLVAVCLAGFVIYCLWARRFIPLIVICCVFMLGMGWYFLGISTFTAKPIEQVCQIEGRLSDDVTDYGWRYAGTLKDVKINGETERDIYITISKSDDAEFAAGDVISFEGRVLNAKMFELESFENIYYRKNTPYVCSIKSSEITTIGNKLTLDEKFRIKVKSVIYSSMGEANGAVAYAVLFGDKSEVDADVKNTYNYAGIIHLLTVSGLHVSFLIVLLGFILKKCRVRGIWNFLICAIFLLGYAYLCGFAPSVVRAGIMGLVLLFTRFSGKCYDNLNAVGLAGLLILIFSPLSAFDVGFLMSFFCVISIFVVSPNLSKFFKRFLPKFVGESFAVSISANLGILPFGASIFGVLNLLSFFVNLIVVPFFGLLYPFLFVISLLTCALPFMSFLLKVCGWGFNFIYKIAEFFGTTHLIFVLEPINVFLIALFFVFLFLTAKFFMASKRVKIICCSSVLSLFFVVALILQIPLPQKTSVSYGYNYNQTVLLQSSSGESAFVDYGGYAYSKKLMYCQDAKVQSLFMLNTVVKINDVHECGVQNVVSCEVEQECDDIVVVEKDEQGKIGSFVFTYKSHNGILLGLEIEFDDIKVLVLANTAKEALSSGAEVGVYDFVMLGINANLANYFFDSKILLSVYDNNEISASYQKYGNICYDITGNNFKWRCLD